MFSVCNRPCVVKANDRITLGHPDSNASANASRQAEQGAQSRSAIWTAQTCLRFKRVAAFPVGRTTNSNHNQQNILFSIEQPASQTVKPGLADRALRDALRMERGFTPLQFGRATLERSDCLRGGPAAPARRHLPL
jgi:hypothetical protein